MTTNSSNGSFSFSEAIEATQSLMNKIATGEIDESTIEREVSAIVSTKNGGRGFFVAYLTSEMLLADSPSQGIVEGLKSSIAVTSELLVKNLAMSSAMMITHTRNDDADNIRGSQRVRERTGKLIKQIQLETIDRELEKLKATVSQGEGDYQDFVARWGYDTEQKKAIQKAIADL